MRFHLLALPGALAAASLLTSPVLARSTERNAGQEAANLEQVTEFHQSVFLDHKVKESEPTSVHSQKLIKQISELKVKPM